MASESMAQAKLYLGDCLGMLREMADGSVDAIVTDPPYNVVNRATGGLRQIDKGGADELPVQPTLLAAEFARVCRGSVYVWCGSEQVSEWRAAFVRAKMTTRQCVWEKSNPSPMNAQSIWLSSVELCIFARKPKATFNRFYESPVWRGPSQRVEGFPCPKPVWLMAEAIDASTELGATVLDPFMGSGTTGVACMNTGRNFIGIELDEGYFKIASDRIAAAQAARKAVEHADA
jgi:DNA modification methylase